MYFPVFNGIYQGRSTYTSETGKHYKSGFTFPENWLLNICQCPCGPQIPAWPVSPPEDLVNMQIAGDSLRLPESNSLGVGPEDLGIF